MSLVWWVDVLKYEEVERPEPQAGEVLVGVRAASINPVDAISRQLPLPVTSGVRETCPLSWVGTFLERLCVHTIMK
jgi:NADPH:quinone reductase-like Zn-dependent oxidoreductase